MTDDFPCCSSGQHIPQPSEYDETWPQTHTRVVAQTWPMDCIEGGCSHRDERGEPEDMSACPSTMTAVCDECSGVTAEDEGPVLTWPCENAAVQSWQRQGGSERSRAVMVEAFLRGWRERGRSADAG